MCGGVAGCHGLLCGSYRPVAVVCRWPVGVGFASAAAAPAAGRTHAAWRQAVLSLCDKRWPKWWGYSKA